VTAPAPDELTHLLGGAFTSNDLADLCAAIRLPIAGSKDERIHRLVTVSLPRFDGRVSDRPYAASCNCSSYAAGLM